MDLFAAALSTIPIRKIDPRLLHRITTLIIVAGIILGSDSPLFSDGTDFIRCRPNIILILADDLGYGDLGSYGATDISTPHLDRLAREGTRFTSFYVAQPVCTASRAALLAGCYPNRIGMAGALNHLSTVGIHPDETLLSERLRSAGYATAIFGKWHLGHQPPFLPTRRGFDTFAGIPYSNDNGPLHPVIRGIPALPWYENEAITERDPDQALFTERLTDRAVEFIGRNKERQFFLYVPHIMPHVPIFARPELQGKSGRGLYGDVVQELDTSVGAIVAALEQHGLTDRTLVVFVSDNGPFLSYGEHAGSSGKLREGKLTMFEGGVRVPCIMRWPGHVPAGRTCDELVTTMDLNTTLLQWCAPASPMATDGTNLGPLFLGENGAKARDQFWYYSGDELHAVRQGKWKLHVPHEYLTVAAAPGRAGKPSNYENMKPLAITQSGIRGIASRHGYRVEPIELSLYDLEADPGESRNVATEHPDVVAQLQTVVEQARAELGDSLTKRVGQGVRPVGTFATDHPEPRSVEGAPEARVVADRGYEKAIELRRGRIRAVLCPEAGGRVLEFSVDGRNALYFDPQEATPQPGKPRGASAGRFDIGPELTVIPHPQLWSGPWTAEITGPTAARLTSLRCEQSGIRLIRDFTLSGGSSEAGDGEGATPRLECKQTIVNESGEVREVCHWGRSFSPGGGIALVPLGDRPSRFPSKYAMYEEGAILNVRNADDRIRHRDGFLEVLAPPRKPKLGFDSYAGWLGYLMPGDLLFVKRFHTDPDRVYNEAAGLTLSVWYPEGARIELEPIGPRERLAPGQRASFTETWTLHTHPFPKADQRIDLRKLSEQVQAEAPRSN